MRKKRMIVASVLLLITILAGSIPAKAETGSEETAEKATYASGWEVLSYLDDAGNETGDQFVFGESEGTYTTIEGIGKELVGTVFVDRQDVMIGLWKKGETRVTNSSKTEVKEYTVRIRLEDEDSEILIDSIMPPGADRIYLRTMEVRDGEVYYNSNQEKVVDLLKNGSGTILFVVKEAETLTSYNFRIDVADFRDRYYELESEEKKAAFIEAVDQIDLTDENAYSQLEKAGEALEELSAGDREELSEYAQTYEASEKEYHQQRIDNVSNLIEAIGTVRLDSSEEAINEAKEAYDGLSADEQKQVTNSDKLTRAIEEFRELKAAHEAEIRENAGKVMALIDDIAGAQDAGGSAAPEMNEETGEKIYQAKTAYENLTEEEQDLVTDTEVLESACAGYEENVLAPAKEAILAIGEVTIDSGELIAEAKAKAALISPSWREGLEEIKTLEQAEEQYQELLLAKIQELTEQLSEADAEEENPDFEKIKSVLEQYEELPDAAKESVEWSDRIADYRALISLQEDYEVSLKLLEDKKYTEAYYSFLEILDYSDSKAKAEEILTLCDNCLDSGSGYKIFAPPEWEFADESASSADHVITWSDADENAELKFIIYNRTTKSTEEIYDEEKNSNNRNVSLLNIQDDINAVYWTDENSSTITWSDPDHNLVYEVVMDVKDPAAYENIYQQMIDTVFGSLRYEETPESEPPMHFTYAKNSTDQILYDNPNCYLAVTKVYEADATNGLKMALYAENRTDKELEFSIQGISMDHWEPAQNAELSQSVPARDYKLWLVRVEPDSQQESSSKIKSIEFLLRVTDVLSGDVLHEDRMYIKP